MKTLFAMIVLTCSFSSFAIDGIGAGSSVRSGAHLKEKS